MKKYEAIFILDERNIQDTGETLVQEIETLAKELGGSLVEKEFMGKKTFAAPINKQKTGIYWSLILSLEPDKVKPFEDAYRLNNKVLRLVVFIYDRPEKPITLN